MAIVSVRAWVAVGDASYRPTCGGRLNSISYNNQFDRPQE